MLLVNYLLFFVCGYPTIAGSATLDQKTFFVYACSKVMHVVECNNNLSQSSDVKSFVDVVGITSYTSTPVEFG